MRLIRVLTSREKPPFQGPTLQGVSPRGRFINGGALLSPVLKNTAAQPRASTSRPPCPSVPPADSHKAAFKVVTHQAPPQGICVGLKFLFHLFSLGIHLRHIFLNQVDEK